MGTKGAILIFAVVQVVMTRQAGALEPTRHPSQLVHRSFTAREGLPHNLANSVAQTPDGYLWIGSEEGLSRYDGFRFVTYTRKDGLPSNAISALAVDGDTLWIGTREHGLVARRGDRLVSVDTSSISLQIRALAIDRTGDLWIGTRDRGVAKLHDGHVVARFSVDEGLPSNDVRGLFVASSGAVWIATFLGLAHIAGDRVTQIPELAGVASYAVAEDRHGDLWLGTAKGLARWQATGRIDFVDIGLSPDPAVLELASDRDGSLWIGHSRGLVRRTDTGVVESVRDVGTRALALLEDREGTIWMGNDRGLDSWNEGDILGVGAAEGLTDDGLFGVLEDASGAMWVASDRGLYRRPVDGVATNIAPDRGTVYTVFEDRHHDVWAGARDGSVGRWHDGAFTWLGRGSWEKVRTIVAADDSGVWLGTDHGLFRMRDDHVDNAEAIVRGPIVSAITIDREGALWLGTEASGLRRVRVDGAAAPVPAGGPPATSSVTTVSFDGDGALWVGTEGDGLWLLRAGRWGVIDSHHGMFDDVVWSVVDDGRGWVWMSSNRGVSRVARAQLIAVAEGAASHVDAIAYGTSDGMRSAECNGAVSPPAWRARDGRLWFPTAIGAAVADPAHLRPPGDVAALVESVRVDGQPAPSRDLVVPPGSSRLEVSYTAPSLRAPEALRFRFRLEPFDDNWNDARGQHVAQYTNLAPGTYRFIVQAGVADHWGPEATLSVTLEPHIYETAWFRISVIVVCAVVILTIPLLRVRQLRARERFLAVKVQEALSEVKVLAGLLPICAWCKQIRDDKGYWSRIEAYLGKHTDAKFTHGICPDCFAKQEREADAEEAAEEREKLARK